MIKIGDRISSVIARRVMTGIVDSISESLITWHIERDTEFLSVERHGDHISEEGVEWIAGTDPEDAAALLAAHLLARSTPE